MKKYTPKVIKELIKNIIDFIYWVLNYRKIPVIIKNRFGINQLLYPWDKRYISIIKNSHDYEKEFSAADQLIKSGDTLFDIGANIGINCSYYSKLVGGTGIIFAFEPVIETFEMLNETLSLNQCTNVHTYNLGISDKSGSAFMMTFEKKYHAQNSLGNVMMDNHLAENKKEVILDTLDQFCITKNIQKIDFLKVDVEGFEENVFKGSSKLLIGHKIKYIQFEISLNPLVGSGNSISSLFSTLNKYGYQVYRYNDISKKFSGPINQEDNNFDNYFASYLDLTKLN